MFQSMLYRWQGRLCPSDDQHLTKNLLVGTKEWVENTISGWIAKACCTRCREVGKGEF